MPRYIDSDILKDLYQPIDGKDYNVNMAIIRANIDDIPTADVQEVKHGKWELSVEPLGMKDVDCAKCSLCGELFIVDEDYDFDYIKEFFKYCPNCGTKMDGKD